MNIRWSGETPGVQLRENIVRSAAHQVMSSYFLQDIEPPPVLYCFFILVPCEFHNDGGRLQKS